MESVLLILVIAALIVGSLILFSFLRHRPRPMPMRHKVLLMVSVILVLFLGGLQVSFYIEQQGQSERLADLLTDAARGDATAQTKLGNFYEKGYGTPKDLTKAFEWYYKAARQGETRAQTSIAVMFAYGEGVTRNWIEAVRWFRVAAARGNTNAMGFLSLMLEEPGRGQNLIESYKWNLIDARLRADNKQSRQNDIAKKMTAIQIMTATAQADTWQAISGPLSEAEFAAALPKLP